MRVVIREQRKQALWDWLRWAPVVAIPLSVLFADAWLHVQNWRRDFELGRLAERRQALSAALSEDHVVAASLQDLDRLEYMADKLGLVEPDPTQIVTINAASFLPAAPDPFALASLQAADARDMSGHPEAGMVPEGPLADPPVLEDIPDSPPVRGIGLVTLETVEDDLEAELRAYTEVPPR